jgi:hypothetical protein
MHRTVVLSAAVFGASAAVACADIIRYDFTGTVTFVSPQSPFGVIAQPGDPVDGVFVFDQSTADSSPGDAFFGSYPTFIPSGFSFFFNNSNTLAKADAYQVLITDDNPPNNTFDELEVYATEGIEINGQTQPTADMYVQFRDDLGACFSDDSLPGWELTLADFVDNDGLNLPNGWLLDVATGDRIEFGIDTLIGVPAPGALAIGLLGMLFASRRRRA